MNLRTTRIASSLLLAAGIVLVFSGLSAALGFTVPGMLASIGAIAALLYAGAVWFGGPAPLSASRPLPNKVLVFDHSLTLTSGEPLLAQFPESEHAELRVRCQAALGGQRSHVTLGTRPFDVAPIVSSEGVVLYGALIERSFSVQHS